MVGSQGQWYVTPYGFHWYAYRCQMVDRDLLLVAGLGGTLSALDYWRMQLAPLGTGRPQLRAFVSGCHG